MSLISLFDLVNFTENEKKTIETAEHSSIDFSSVWERILLTIKELQTSESDSSSLVLIFQRIEFRPSSRSLKAFKKKEMLCH